MSAISRINRSSSTIRITAIKISFRRDVRQGSLFLPDRGNQGLFLRTQNLGANSRRELKFRRTCSSTDRILENVRLGSKAEILTAIDEVGLAPCADQQVYPNRPGVPRHRSVVGRRTQRAKRI